MNLPGDQAEWPFRSNTLFVRSRRRPQGLSSAIVDNVPLVEAATVGGEQASKSGRREQWFSWSWWEQSEIWIHMERGAGAVFPWSTGPWCRFFLDQSTEQRWWGNGTASWYGEKCFTSYIRLTWTLRMTCGRPFSSTSQWFWGSMLICRGVQDAHSGLKLTLWDATSFVNSSSLCFLESKENPVHPCSSKWFLSNVFFNVPSMYGDVPNSGFGGSMRGRYIWFH